MFLDREVGTLHEPLSGRVWDRAEIARRWRERMAAYQGRGLEPSDRVFLHFGNTLEFFVELLAIWSLGGCVAPIDSRLTDFEIETLAAAAQPRFSVWLEPPDPRLARSLESRGAAIVDAAEPSRSSSGDRRLPDVGLDTDALILFTSGTTGRPKGVVHTRRSLLARWMSLRQALGLETFRRTLCLLPTHFGHGLICNSLFPWLSGMDLFVLPPFRSDLLTDLGGILDRHEITFLSSVPSVWRLALRTARPPARRLVERVFCGSAPLSAQLWRGIQDWTGTPQVWNAYGITETGSWLAGSSGKDLLIEDGFIGEPWGSVVRVLRRGAAEEPGVLPAACLPGEAGDIWVNTPALMRGYLGRDDLTQQVVRHGWFSTGDIGLLDDRGLLFLRGREREEINKGGMKVYPGDIDAVAERFEGALDVCTFGFADPLLGENVGIAVVLEEAKEPVVMGRLLEWMRRHLARHQMPARWYVLEEIPRTSRGKVNRASVAQHCATLDPFDVRSLPSGDARGGHS